jgi:hypothetical protein
MRGYSGPPHGLRTSRIANGGSRGPGLGEGGSGGGGCPGSGIGPVLTWSAAACAPGPRVGRTSSRVNVASRGASTDNNVNSDHNKLYAGFAAVHRTAEVE